MDGGVAVYLPWTSPRSSIETDAAALHSGSWVASSGGIGRDIVGCAIWTCETSDGGNPVDSRAATREVE